MGTLILLSALLGCHNFTTVDEACPKRTPGAKKLAETDQDNAEAVQRANCYRRLATLGKGRVDKHITLAVHSHLNYLVANDAVNNPTLDWLTEDPSNPGFTGVGPWDRHGAAGYEYGTVGETGVWMMFDYGDPDQLSGPDIIDTYMHNPFVREVILQPAWRAAGVAESPVDDLGNAYWELDVVFDYPADQHVNRPIVYPKDGQLDVPVSYDYRWHPDLADTVGIGGYAITVTVGSDKSDAGAALAFTEPNPYGLYGISHSLTGPNGPIDVVFLDPDINPKFSVVYAPVDPLEPNTTYTFEATVQWVWGQKTIESSFTTGAEDSPTTARRSPPRLRFVPPRADL